MKTAIDHYYLIFTYIPLLIFVCPNIFSEPMTWELIDPKLSLEGGLS